jgi:hypothetical protein
VRITGIASGLPPQAAESIEAPSTVADPDERIRKRRRVKNIVLNLNTAPREVV